ncbi:MAG: lactonase family protein [Candidatus Latescibacteria bacterium]|nr:lactonase family protein [Candidatus Latescibacterota bacterium]
MSNNYVYISLPSAAKIACYTQDPDTGKLSFLHDTALPAGAAPLAVDRPQRCLYAALGSSQIASFAIAPDSGELKSLGLLSLSAVPCFLSLDQTGRFLLSAYYTGGAAAVHPLNPDGSVGEVPAVWLSTARCAHAMLTDPSNRFAFVPHVSSNNVIFQFLFDEKTGRLEPNRVSKIKPLPGAGPRHYVFHPTLPVVYFDNEQGSSVTAYHLDGQGSLSPFQTLSTLPEGFSRENSCAHIAIHPSGRFLYAANRGHDSLACFALDAQGKTTSLGQQATEKTPTHFALDAAGRFLYAAGQGGDRLASYRVDPENGQLSPLEAYTVGANPYWVLPVSPRKA